MPARIAAGTATASSAEGAAPVPLSTDASTPRTVGVVVGRDASTNSDALGRRLAECGYPARGLHLPTVLAARALPPGLGALVVAIGRSELRRGAAIRALRQIDPDLPIVVVSDGTWRQVVRDAIAAGADAYVDRAHDATDLGIATAAAISGHVCVPRTVRRAVVPAALSVRERQVLACVCGGLTNRQIADKLFLSENTVKSHLTSGFRKLGVASRAEAVAALSQGQTEGMRWRS